MNNIVNKNDAEIPVLIELPTKDSVLFDEFALNCPEKITIVESKRFTGADVVQALIILSSITIHSVAKIIIEQIRSKKDFSIKIKGIEIKGISEKNVLTILEKFFSNSHKNE